MTPQPLLFFVIRSTSACQVAQSLVYLNFLRGKPNAQKRAAGTMTDSSFKSTTGALFFFSLPEQLHSIYCGNPDAVITFASFSIVRYTYFM